MIANMQIITVKIIQNLYLYLIKIKSNLLYVIYVIRFIIQKIYYANVTFVKWNIILEY